MAKVKYYAIAKGLTEDSVGIYNSWSECERHIKGVSNAKYKSFSTEKEAVEYIKENSEDIKTNYINATIKEVTETKEEIEERLKPTFKISKAKNVIEVTKYIEPDKKITEESNVFFVDGSYNRERKVYGCGIVLLNKNNINDIDDIEVKGYIAAGIDYWDQWNIIGEIEASKCAIDMAVKNKKKKVIIYHDLEGTAKWACGKYKAKNVYTMSYVDFIEDYSKKIDIEFIKVKGHSGNKYNELADQYAKKAIVDYK